MGVFAKTAHVPPTSPDSLCAGLNEAFQLAEFNAPESADPESSGELAPLDHPIQPIPGHAEEFRRLAKINYLVFLRHVPTSPMTRST